MPVGYVTLRQNPYAPDLDLPRNRTARRYAIWCMQSNEGHEACFGTAQRLDCNEVECPFRAECVGLRAPWRR